MSQFNDPTMGSPPPKKSSAGKWIIIVLVVLIVLPLVCCGIPSLFMYSGFNKAMSEGAKQIIQPVANAPEIQQNIGNIDTANMNLFETGSRKA